MLANQDKVVREMMRSPSGNILPRADTQTPEIRSGFPRSQSQSVLKSNPLSHVYGQPHQAPTDLRGTTNFLTAPQPPPQRYPTSTQISGLHSASPSQRESNNLSNQPPPTNHQQPANHHVPIPHAISNQMQSLATRIDFRPFRPSDRQDRVPTDCHAQQPTPTVRGISEHHSQTALRSPTTRNPFETHLSQPIAAYQPSNGHLTATQQFHKNIHFGVSNKYSANAFRPDIQIRTDLPEARKSEQTPLSHYTSSEAYGHTTGILKDNRTYLQANNPVSTVPLEEHLALKEQLANAYLVIDYLNSKVNTLEEGKRLIQITDQQPAPYQAAPQTAANTSFKSNQALSARDRDSNDTRWLETDQKDPRDTKVLFNTPHKESVLESQFHESVFNKEKYDMVGKKVKEANIRIRYLVDENDKLIGRLNRLKATEREQEQGNIKKQQQILELQDALRLEKTLNGGDFNDSEKQSLLSTIEDQNQRIALLTAQLKNTQQTAGAEEKEQDSLNMEAVGVAKKKKKLKEPKDSSNEAVMEFADNIPEKEGVKKGKRKATAEQTEDPAPKKKKKTIV